jgi:multiple sugar transport system permease protein
VTTRKRKAPAAIRRRRMLTTVANHAVLIAVSLMFLLPILFILLTALMTDQQAMTTHLIPRPWMWSNFKAVFKQIDLLRYTWNTFLYASLCTVGVVVSCVTVAYAFSRIHWRGRNLVFLLVLSTLMLPQQITTVPLFVVWARDLPNWISWMTSHVGLGATHLQFVGTLKPLIIPAFFGDAFSIFLLRQFFMTIPEELCDAVRVDGGGHWQILRRVVIPLSKPAIMAIALFQFIYSWNDFYGPLVYLGQNPQAQTLSLALSNFRGMHHVQWNLTMAATMVFMIPVVIIFFLAQRVFIEGITLTGVKG